MNRLQNRKARDLQKPVPGCMGTMINIFDLSTGTARTKLLTEKAHLDGSPIRTNQPDVVKAMDATEIQIDDKSIDSGLWNSSKKSDGTPVKMLIAQEMSGETESKQQMPPNVVARLMGLDVLPVQLSVRNARRSSLEGYPRNTLAGLLRGYQQQEEWYYENPTPHKIQPCAHEKEYNESLTEKRMELVRQKFIEAKRLATDGKLVRSKEFQDALEVLSSNRDLFLKYLEEPNSLSSKHIHGFNTIAPLLQTRRITVLKPTRTIESNGVKHMQKHHESSNFTHQKVGSVSQSTKIVLLKPSPGKPHEIKNTAGGRDAYMGTEDAMGSREVAKAITQRMRISVNSNRRDEALLSSVLSNGYVRDDSSLNRSEDDCIEDYGCNSSDSEIVTPTSRHSWDSINRLDSPHLISSSSRASYSPESSVIREAKKRLSERWALVATNGISQEQRQERSSSTLGQMLAISEVKREEGSDECIVLSKRSSGGEEDPMSISGTKDGFSGENSNPSKNLSRSKSVPVSSLLYEIVGLNKEVGKSKSGKSTFKERVSSLFFSRSKKPGTDKPVPSTLVSSDVQYGIMEADGKRSDDLPRTGHNSCPQECAQTNCEGESGNTSSLSWNNGLKQSISLMKTAPKPRTSEKSEENEDQPSPISVLEAPFEDDASNNASRSFRSRMVGNPQALSRSPPIESLARSLSREDPRSKISSPKPFKHSRGLYEEHEQFVFVQKLLSSAGLDVASTVFARWHSLDSPLDPMLMDEFLARKEEWSNQKLLFDFVNAALVDIGCATLTGAYPWARACGGALKVGPTGAPVAEVVWGLVRNLPNCPSSEGEWVSGEAKNSGLAVDRTVKREVAGRGWAERMWSEIDEFSKEIGGVVLDELVEEALTDLTDGCL